MASQQQVLQIGARVEILPRRTHSSAISRADFSVTRASGKAHVPLFAADHVAVNPGARAAWRDLQIKARRRPDAFLAW